METSCNPIMIELLQGYELTRKLQAHLHQSCQVQTSKSLTESIMVCFQNAMASVESLRCPKTDKDRRRNTRKRKDVQKCTKQIEVGLNEGPPVDGYCWRKYGQKDILDSKHPRSYFRCSFFFSEGCLAKKLVQKSDEDLTIYLVTYSGEHTCSRIQSVKFDDSSSSSSVISPSFDPSPSIDSFLLENYFSQSGRSCLNSLSTVPMTSMADVSMPDPSFESEEMDFDSLKSLTNFDPSFFE
ncbi:hypothetical protein ZOSMA_222G00320 [Zostera marina]|uniref:WRKY domain-containing protein n=1 Tax=Zostera marina TaxID=29655 RepID=A0A0K9PLI3_ZOSMR|nr:hypothetical protein ZOSMA_222G00320 [Zostera marina]